MVLVALYRPPSCSTTEALNMLSAIEEILSVGYNTTILGGLNIPDVLWCKNPPKTKGSVASELVSLVTLWHMSQLVVQPTRLLNILDIILTTAPSAFQNCQVEPPISSSHHSAILIEVTLPRRLREASIHKECTHKKIDYDALATQLSKTDLMSLITQTLDVNDMWSNFQNVLVQAIECSSRSSLSRKVHIARYQRTLYLRKRRRWKQWKLKPSKRNKIRFASASIRLSAAIFVSGVAGNNGSLNRRKEIKFVLQVLP